MSGNFPKSCKGIPSYLTLLFDVIITKKCRIENIYHSTLTWLPAPTLGNILILFLHLSVTHLPNLSSSHSVTASHSRVNFISVTIPFTGNSCSNSIPRLSSSIPHIFTLRSIPAVANILLCLILSIAAIQPLPWASWHLNTGLVFLIFQRLTDPSWQAVINLYWLMVRTLSIA